MDWKRFQELTSLVLARAGFDSEIAWVRPNGAVVLHVTSRGRRSRMEALVQCAAWSMFHVDATSVLEFYRAVVSEGVQRGIYVTPGSFGADARLFSRNKRLELLDGEEFLGTIRRMSAEERIITSAWPPWVPGMCLLVRVAARKWRFGRKRLRGWKRTMIFAGTLP